MKRHSRHLAWRRNWWLIAALAGFSAGMLVLMGSEVVVPYTSSSTLAAQTRRDAAAKQQVRTIARGLPGRDVAGTVDLFDDSLVHRVSIAMAPVEYDTMIADYQNTGVKSWHPATVTIDGVDVERVGVRLKGNSTLIGLRYGGPNSPPAPPVIASLGKLTRDDPQKMPLLLRFDEFVPGQRYQGVNELALRTAGGFGGDSTQLTELVANRLTRAYGGPYLRTVAAGMSFNQSSEGFYLLVEHPDDYWARRMLPGTKHATLYKAIVGARFRYAGPDPASYAKVFNQQAETRDIGPRPMIDFLKFVEQSTDRQFDARLAAHLDVVGFTRYLAFHNLIVDPDSLAGTGNNYYVLYVPRLARVSFAAWDQNLAFGRLGFVGARYRPYYEDGAGIPAQLRNIPGLEELVPGEGLGEPNLLVTRFLESPKFRSLYDRTYRELFTDLLQSGRAGALLDRLGTVIRTANVDRHLVDPAKFDTDLARNHAFLAGRIAFLETVSPITN